MPEPLVRRFAAFLRKMRLDARALLGVILLAYVGGAVYVCSVAGQS